MVIHYTGMGMRQWLVWNWDIHIVLVWNWDIHQTNNESSQIGFTFNRKSTQSLSIQPIYNHGSTYSIQYCMPLHTMAAHTLYSTVCHCTPWQHILYTALYATTHHGSTYSIQYCMPLHHGSTYSIQHCMPLHTMAAHTLYSTVCHCTPWQHILYTVLYATAHHGSTYSIQYCMPLHHGSTYSIQYCMPLHTMAAHTVLYHTVLLAHDSDGPVSSGHLRLCDHVQHFNESASLWATVRGPLGVMELGHYKSI